jgi:thiamine-monophosphate kinase
MVNMSDVLSDGGTPLFFIIGVGAPSKDHPLIQELYAYYSRYTKEWNIPVIGGDTVSSPVFFLSVTCVGRSPEKPWLRKNAQPGDNIYLTGELGASAYGFEKIQAKGHDLSDTDIYSHLFPPFHQKSVSYLQGKVNAAIDISDGLLPDLSHILEESQKGAEIFEIKIPFASGLPEDRSELAFYGGEDYQILFTTPWKIDEADFLKETGFRLSCIGKITDNMGKIVLQKIEKSLLLKIKDIQDKGFDHWNSSPTFMKTGKKT